jgi:hypothetical protein
MEIKREIYIIILVSFLFAVALVLFFVYPLLKEIKNDSQQIISQKNDVLLLKNDFDEVQKFQKKYETFKPDLDKLDGMFVDSQNPVDFIKFIEKFASDFEIEAELSAPSFSQDGPPNFIELRLSCMGDFPKILKFINALETGNYLIQVKNLDIKNFKDIQGSKKAVIKTQAAFSIKAFTKQ